MGIADDIINRANCLAADRLWWETTWRDIAALVMPAEPMSAFNAMTGGVMGKAAITGAGAPLSTDRVKTIYDNTGMVALDRLAAGMESLVTPQSEKWHGLSFAGLESAKPTVDESIYLENLRNFQFDLRYDARSGFIPAHQRAMRSAIGLGTGIMYVEQGDGRPRPGDPDTVFRYCFAPITECLLAVNDYATVDTCIRVRTMTVKQLVNKFTLEKCSAVVQGLYEKGNFDQLVTIIHATMPRAESGSSYLEGSIKSSKIASYYVERDTKHLLSDGGYFEFPYVVYHWMQSSNGPYGESPVMLALSEIKSLQLMGKGELRAFGQWTDPPLGTYNDGVMNRPNLNPRAVNPGAVGADGSLRVRPLITSQNPDFAEKVMEVRRNMVNNTMYVNLFQILIKNPEMSATEAMLRANEKGELLGPAGGKIQMGLSIMADREMGILERKGVMAPNGALPLPPKLQGKSIGVKFTSPLDRLRRMNEGIGTTRMLEAVLPLAKAKPQVLDLLDEDQIVANLREIFGAPANSLVNEDTLAARRKATEDKMAKAEQLQAGGAAAGIAKDASIAGRNVGDTAQQSPQIADALSQILDRMKGGVQGNPDAPPQAVDGANALLSQFGKGPVQQSASVPG